MTVDSFQDVNVDGNKFRVPQHLQLIKRVGSGAYGCVASFEDKRAGGKIAVKKISDAFHDLVDGKRILREVKLLRHLSHFNIIHIMDMYPPDSPEFQDIYIVTDLMETDLHRVINSKQPLEEDHHRWFVHQLLRGLAYLHHVRVVHRDIKPSNLLVNRNCDLKICDFGLARVLAPGDEAGLTRTDYVVTRWYRAPEVVLLASEYTVSIDMWAAGCILCELITRKPAFAGRDHLDQIKKIVHVLGTPAEDELHWLPLRCPARTFLKRCPWSPKTRLADLFPKASSASLEVIEALLRFDPVARATAQDALRLRYFSELFDEQDLQRDLQAPPIDWSFDNFEPTKQLLQKYIYQECASFHPEIIERDQDLLPSHGLQSLLPGAAESGQRSHKALPR